MKQKMLFKGERNIFFLKFILILELVILNVNCIEKHEVRLTNLGELMGSYMTTAWSNETIVQFLGIPYGISPSIQNNRFKEVEEVKAWKGVKNATAYKRRCPDPNVPGSYKKYHINDDIEDCLTLNVYTKALHSLRPVMVYVYDNNEFTNISDYAPVYLMDKRDIVYVSISYRTGILGFAAMDLIDMPGNVGVKDVELALKWIKTHITQFGGDPNQVTLFGDPSIVGALLISHSIDKRLFKRAIIQSMIYDGLKNNTKTEIGLICSMLGVCSNCTDDIATVSCFKQVDITRLMEQSQYFKFTMTQNDNNAQPIITTTKDLLIDNPKDTKYPLMLGVTKHDGTYLVASFAKFLTMFNADESMDVLLGQLGVDKHYYFNKTQINEKNLNNLLPGIVDILSDRFAKTPLLKFIKRYRKLNSNNLYLYTFDYVGSYTLLSKKLQTDYPIYPSINGVHHGDDLLYLFNLVNLTNKNDINMAKTMVNLWTSFAIDGKPKPNSNQNIPYLTSDVGPYFHINHKITIGKNFTNERNIGNTEFKLGIHMLKNNSMKILEISIFYTILINILVLLIAKLL